MGVLSQNIACNKLNIVFGAMGECIIVKSQFLLIPNQERRVASHTVEITKRKMALAGSVLRKKNEYIRDQFITILSKNALRSGQVKCDFATKLLATKAL